MVTNKEANITENKYIALVKYYLFDVVYIKHVRFYIINYYIHLLTNMATNPTKFIFLSNVVTRIGKDINKIITMLSMKIKREIKVKIKIFCLL